MLKKVWRFSWWLVLLILFLVFSTLYYIATTQSGTKWTLKTLSALTPGLVISGIEGNWNDGLGVGKLLFNSDSLEFTANNLLVQWNWPDVLSGKFTINKLDIADIVLRTEKLSDSSNKEIKIETKQTLLDRVAKYSLPVDLEISDLQIRQGMFSNGEDTWRVSSFSVAINYKQNQWSILDLNADLDVMAQNKKSYSIELRDGDSTLMMEMPFKAEGKIDLQFDSYLEKNPGNISINIAAAWQGPLSNWSLDINNKFEYRGETDELTGRYKFNGLFDFSQVDPLMDLTLVTDDISHWQTKDNLLQLSEAQFQIKGTVSKYHLEGSWNASFKEGAHGDENKGSAESIIGSINSEGDQQGLIVNRLLMNYQQQDLIYEGQVKWLPVFNIDGRLVLDSFDLSPWLKQKLSDHPDKISAMLNGNLNIKAGSRNGGWLQLSSDNIAGQWLNNPLTIKGGFEWQSQAIKFDQLMLAVGSNQVNLAGEISQQWQLSSEIDLENLGELWPGLSGQLYGKVNAIGEKENPQLQFEGSAPIFAFKNWTVKSAKLQVALYPFKPSPVSAGLFIKEIIGPKFKTDQIKIALTGSEVNHLLSLETKVKPKVSAQWQGSWSRESKKWQATWQNFFFEQSENHLFQLAKTTTTTFGMEPLSLVQAPLCFKADKNKAKGSKSNDQSLCLQGVVAQKNATASIDINNVDLAWLNPWFKDSTVNGWLSAHNTFIWQADRVLKIEGDVELEDVKVLKLNDQMLDVQPEVKVLSINYHLIDNQWQLAFKGRLDNRTVNAVDVKTQGSLPLTIPERIELRLNQVALAPWKSLIPELQALEGNLTTDIVLEKNQSDGFMVTGKSHLSKGLIVFGTEEFEQYKNIEFEIDFKEESANWSLAFDGLNGQHWASSSVWTFNWSPDLKDWELERNCFKSLSSNLFCAEINRSEEQGIHALVALSGDSSTLLKGLLPEELSLQGGLLSEFSLDYDGELAADFNFSANNNQLTLSQSDTPDMTWPLNTFSIESRYQNQNFKISANVQGESLGMAYLDMNFPFIREANGKNISNKSSKEKKAFKGQVDINNFRLSVLKPFLPVISNLDGSLSMKGTFINEASINNTDVENPYPILNGKMTLSDGFLSSVVFPVSAENLKLSVDIIDNQASINGSMSSGKGSAVIGGTATTIMPDWHAHITLKGEQIPVIKAPEIDLLINTDVFLDISPKAINLGGELIVKEGFVTLEKLPKGSVKVSSDVVFIDQLQSEKKKGDEIDFKMNLSVHLNELVKLKAPGVEGRLEGEIFLKQSKEPIEATGYLNVVEGRYFGIGPRLTVRKGRIDFRGPLSEPYLFIEAIRIVEDVTVGLRIQGSMDSPQMTFFSDPAMPDDKVLVYLLTGKPPGNEPMDTQQITNQALLSLSIYGGEGYAQSLAQKFGVRDLEVSTRADSDDTSINVGGYLSSKVYVEYGHSLFSPVNSFTVRYRLRKGLFLEAVSGLESALELLYTFEF